MEAVVAHLKLLSHQSTGATRKHDSQYISVYWSQVFGSTSSERYRYIDQSCDVNSALCIY
jgi:hypothetical protein